MLSAWAVTAGADDARFRISDEQRRSAEQELTQHRVAGRLTLVELNERPAGDWVAGCVAGLDPLFRDLPPLVGATAAAHSWKGWPHSGHDHPADCSCTH
jgi:hypothetical protein